MNISQLNTIPAVSVIMASWNRENLLERSLNSLLKQDFSDWELILCDDGSSDNTFMSFKKLQENHRNFIYLRHSHRGLALTRNAGINAASGKYITFLDTDDEYDTAHLRLRFNYMEENPDTALIHGGVKIIGNPYVPDKNNPKENIHLSECVIGATIFARENVFKHLNSFRNIAYSEDSDFIERAQKFFQIEKVDIQTYIYHRDADDSICSTLEKSR